MPTVRFREEVRVGGRSGREVVVEQVQMNGAWIDVIPKHEPNVYSFPCEIVESVRRPKENGFDPDPS